MRRSRALGDLPRIGSQKLVVKATTNEQEAAVTAPVFDDFRNWRLNVDLGQDLDIVGIRDQKILGRRDAAMRLVQDRCPGVGSDVMPWISPQSARWLSAERMTPSYHVSTIIGRRRDARW
jgi:hypothetical protein